MDLISGLESVIQDISKGRYSSRITPDIQDQDTYRTVLAINRLLETVESTHQSEKTLLANTQNEARLYQSSLSDLSGSLVKIAAGDLGFISVVPEIGQASGQRNEDIAVAYSSLKKIQGLLESLEQEAIGISGKIASGSLDVRFDSRQYPGSIQKTVSSLNDLLNGIEQPVREALRVIHGFAGYDFTMKFNPELRVTGEWHDLKTSVDTIGVQINDAFGLINRQIMELSANSQEANASVQEVANSSEQVARNSDAVSENTEQSDAGVRQVLRAMEDLSVTVGEVSQKAESVSRIAQEATVLSREGSEYASKAEEGMGVITRNAGDVDTVISEIQGEMKKINEIVRLITDIANQTNLLALNAAIEAARAGEYGRGFAVVASEVKALALESRESAGKITDMIGNLQKKSQVASDAVSATSKAVQEGNIMLSDTLRIFGRLVTSVEDISNNIEQVASMNEEQAAAVEEITSSMHEVSAMLKETAKEAVDSARATGETSASANQLKVIVDQVAGIAEQISVSMARFRI